MKTVLIVGAGLAGARCAETLRSEGFEGRILLVGEEPVPPYERPALSKQLLAGTREPADLTLRPPAFWALQGIVLLLGRRVSRIDLRGRSALLEDGTSIDWDSLVLATGARPRRLDLGGTPAGVHSLRTLADALAFRDELEPGARLAVVGAGFVGTEVASTARDLGVEVSLIDSRPPLAGVLGREISELLAARCEARGVELRTGVSVASLAAGSAGRVRAVVLEDGREVPCDAVLVGIGAAPAGELLPGRPAAGGVVTDGFGRTELPGVYACGDVANAWRPWLGAPLRVEHWTGAASQGVAVARAILGREESPDELPYFWSDQFGLRLQYVGHADRWARIELEGDGDSFRARYLGADGSLLAALVANRPREVGLLRREIAAARTPLAA